MPRAASAAQEIGLPSPLMQFLPLFGHGYSVFFLNIPPSVPWPVPAARHPPQLLLPHLAPSPLPVLLPLSSLLFGSRTFWKFTSHLVPADVEISYRRQGPLGAAALINGNPLIAGLRQRPQCPICPLLSSTGPETAKLPA